MKPIVGFEKLYAVDRKGGVWSYPKPHAPHGRFLKPSLLGRKYDGKREYLHVCLFLGRRKYRSKLVHRLVAQAFLPNPLNLPQVNHKNGVKTDNRVKNLEWCTNAQNQIHARLLRARK